MHLFFFFVSSIRPEHQPWNLRYIYNSTFFLICRICNGLPVYPPSTYQCSLPDFTALCVFLVWCHHVSKPSFSYTHVSGITKWLSWLTWCLHFSHFSALYAGSISPSRTSFWPIDALTFHYSRHTHPLPAGGPSPCPPDTLAYYFPALLFLPAPPCFIHPPIKTSSSQPSHAF